MLVYSIVLPHLRLPFLVSIYPSFYVLFRALFPSSFLPKFLSSSPSFCLPNFLPPLIPLSQFLLYSFLYFILTSFLLFPSLLPFSFSFVHLFLIYVSVSIETRQQTICCEISMTQAEFEPGNQYFDSAVNRSDTKIVSMQVVSLRSILIFTKTFLYPVSGVSIPVRLGTHRRYLFIITINHPHERVADWKQIVCSHELLEPVFCLLCK